MYRHWQYVGIIMRASGGSEMPGLLLPDVVCESNEG
jgi:hypothetical protein